MKPKLLPLVALLAAGPAGAEGLRAEIVERVVERCYAATVRYHALVRRPGHHDRAAEARLVEALKAAPHTERLIGDLAETVRGLDAGERERLYDVAFVQCFVSGGEHL